MQIGSAVRSLIRWWWVLILITVVMVGGAYALSTTKIDTYSATATVLIETGTSAGQTSLGDIQVSRELGKTYVLLIKTTNLLERVASRPDVDRSVDELRGQLSGKSLPGTQILAITVRDPVPQSVATIANAVAEAFVSQQQDRQLAEISRLQGALRQYGFQESSALITAQFTALDSLSLLEPASIPTKPVSPKPIRDAAIAGILGLSLGSLLVTLLQLLDVRVRSQDHLETLIEAPVLGVLPQGEFETSQKDSRADVLSKMADDFGFSEAINVIAINLGFQLAELDIGLHESAYAHVTITSAQEGEGKTSVASALSVALAELGHKVVLADMDFRKPKLHEVFELKNDEGVTSIFAGRSNVHDVLRDTPYDGLKVITSGILPPNPIQLFRSKLLMEVFAQIRGETEILIVDSAPLLPVADTSALILRSENTILVVDQRKGNRRVLEQAIREIRVSQPAAPVTAILNRATNPDGDLDGYGYGYGYGSYSRYYGVRR